MAKNDCYLKSRQLRERYANVSEMWIWRRLHGDADFPKPLVIEKRRMWKLSDLEKWERKRASHEVA